MCIRGKRLDSCSVLPFYLWMFRGQSVLVVRTFGTLSTSPESWMCIGASFCTILCTLPCTSLDAGDRNFTSITHPLYTLSALYPLKSILYTHLSGTRPPAGSQIHRIHTIAQRVDIAWRPTTRARR